MAEHVLILEEERIDFLCNIETFIGKGHLLIETSACTCELGKRMLFNSHQEVWVLLKDTSSC